MDPNSLPPVWAIGQHESKRSIQVTEQVFRQAQEYGYNILTTPITTPHFHSSVQAILSTYYAQLNDDLSPEDVPIPAVPPLKPTDTTLVPAESMNQIAVASPWIDLASPDPVISNVSRQVLNLELAYTSFCGIHNVLVQAPVVTSSQSNSIQMTQFARAILEVLSSGYRLNLFLVFPISPGKGKRTEDASHLSRFSQILESESNSNLTDLDPWAPWEAWDLVRSICRYNPRLSVALELPRQLPPLPIQFRWFSEPVRLLMVPESSFVPNKHLQPALSRAHQAFLTKYMRAGQPPGILLTDVGPLPSMTGLFPQAFGDGIASIDVKTDLNALSPTPAEAARMSDIERVRNDRTPHLSYLRHLQNHQPLKSRVERYAAGYKDYLQTPLQPLADNLDNTTYEVFESDPIKYEWYEQAMICALQDWSEQGKTTSSTSGAVVVAVAGAGRGPLISRALSASQKSGVPIELWAVEKNPNAFLLLQLHNQTSWARQVTIVKSDMRSWPGPVQSDGSISSVDIIVSELLGSFADNELSPECLDGVQHVLNPVHGISIPESYTAHITPIASPKIHADLLSRAVANKECFDIPHVVMLDQFDFLSYIPPREDDDEAPFNADPASNPIPNVQECWEFSHPLPSAILEQSETRRSGGRTGGSGGLTGGDGWNDHNARFTQLSFLCPTRGVCHGLAGYFETVLYNSITEDTLIELSTNPLTMDAKSKDMISWFPIFFPLKTPVSFPDNSELKLSIWRNTDDRKVWYEWLVESYVIVEGKRMRLGVSELHSSKKNGCLM